MSAEGRLTQTGRDESTSHLFAIHAIMCRRNLICMKSGWRPSNGAPADGRDVTPQSKADGSVRSTREAEQNHA
jgi:hypothetical protein